eukprot:5374342-Prymnesium_polylepis.2
MSYRAGTEGKSQIGHPHSSPASDQQDVIEGLRRPVCTAVCRPVCTAVCPLRSFLVAKGFAFLIAI